MRIHRGLSRILIAGAPAVCVALWVRLQKPVVLPPAKIPAAAADPKIVALDAQLTQLEAAVTRSPQDPKTHLALADFFQSLGRADKIAEQLQEVARLEPDDPLAQLAFGNALLAVMQPKRAEAVYRPLTQRWPRNIHAWQGLATAFYHQGRFLEAATTARVAISLDRKEPNGRYILATSLLEYALQFPDPTEHTDALMQARDNLMLVLGAWPEKGDIYYRLGRVSMELHAKQQAIKNLRRAMELLPTKPEIPWQLAQAYNVTGDKIAARKVLEEGVVRFPRYAGLHDMLGKLLLTSGEPGADQSALQHFQLAVQIAPSVPAFQERYGTSCMRLNRLNEARAAFEKAQELDPNRIYPYQQLAAIYTRLGDRRKASLAAQTAVEMTFNDQQLKRLMAQSSAEPGNIKLHFILANRYQQLGKRGAAKDELLLVLKQDPQNVAAHREIAQLARMPASSTAK